MTVAVGCLIVAWPSLWAADEVNEAVESKQNRQSTDTQGFKQTHRERERGRESRQSTWQAGGVEGGGGGG